MQSKFDNRKSHNFTRRLIAWLMMVMLMMNNVTMLPAAFAEEPVQEVYQEEAKPAQEAKPVEEAKPAEEAKSGEEDEKPTAAGAAEKSGDEDGQPADEAQESPAQPEAEPEQEAAPERETQPEAEEAEPAGTEARPEDADSEEPSEEEATGDADAETGEEADEALPEAATYTVTFEVEGPAQVYAEGGKANGLSFEVESGIAFRVVPDNENVIVSVEADGGALTEGENGLWALEGNESDVRVSVRAVEVERQYAVEFRADEGASVYVDGEDVTNGSAMARDGVIRFTVVPSDGFEIASVVADGINDARMTGKQNEYIIEKITSDGVVVTVATAPAEAPKTDFVYQDSRVYITAVADPEGNLPQSAELKADYLAPGSWEYEQALAKVRAAYAIPEDAEINIAPYDIYFIADGSRIEPEDGKVRVSITFVKPVEAEVEDGVKVASTGVAHIKADGSVDKLDANVRTSAEGAIQSANFTTDSFSTFAPFAELELIPRAASGSVDLVILLDSIDVRINPNADVDHSATIELAFNYTIKNEILGTPEEADTARGSYTWIYDLNDFVGDSKPFESLQVSGGSAKGAIMQGSLRRGEYEISGNEVHLTITDRKDWLDISEEISGTFTLDAKLNAQANEQLSEEAFSFPGAAEPVTVSFKDQDLDTAKKAVTNSGSVTATNGSEQSGELSVNKNPDDGEYEINYELTATANQSGYPLTLADTLSGGQTIKEGSVTISPEENGATFSYNDTTLTVTIPNANKGTTYKVNYTVNVPADAVTEGQDQTNKANWKLGESAVEKTDTTTVTPSYDQTLTTAKGAGNGEYENDKGNGGWGPDTLAVVKQEGEDTARIYYTVTAKPNDDADLITLSDDFSGSAQRGVYFVSVSTTGGAEYDDPDDDPDATSFSMEFTNVSQDEEITVIYYTLIDVRAEGAVNEVQENTATWKWPDADIEEQDETEIIPKWNVKLEVSKSVAKPDGTKPENRLLMYPQAEDNKYYMNYTVTVKPNANVTDLVLTDVISGGQEFVADSFEFEGDDVSNSEYLTVNGDSFEFDIAACLGGEASEDTVYTFTYQTVYTAAEDEDLTVDYAWQDNTATATDEDDGVSGEGTVGVGIGVEHPDVPVDKQVVDAAGENAHENGEAKEPGEVLTYTITVGGKDDNGEDIDLSGVTVTDFISDFMTVVGDITISPAPGGVGTIPVKEDGDVNDGGTVTLFEYVFPTDAGALTDVYTITYQVEIAENPELAGDYIMDNRVKVYDAEPETKTKIHYPNGAGIKKRLDSWDEDRGIIAWSIRVNVTDPVDDLIVKDSESSAYYSDTEGADWGEEQLSILWSHTRVVGADGSVLSQGADYSFAGPEGYSESDYIYFPHLEQSVTIYLETKSPESFSADSDYWMSHEAYWAFNTATLKQLKPTLWGTYAAEEIDSSSASGEITIDKDYSFTKTGVLDSKTGIATWTVTINPQMLVFEPDDSAFLTDVIPEGMTIEGDTVTVEAKSRDGASNVIDLPLSYVCNADGTAIEYDLSRVFYTWNWGFIYEGSNSGTPTGVSGASYTVTYQTKVDEDRLQYMRDNLGNYYFSNTASNGAKSDTATVKYHYDHVIMKTDEGVEFGDTITYRVDVNVNEEQLNNGEPLTLTDRLSTDFELVTNTYSVTSDGRELTEGTEYTFSYNDDSRVITVVVPDETFVTVRFEVLAREGSNGLEREFSNTVELHGLISDSASVSKAHVISKSSSTISGTNDLSISLLKVDENSPKTKLAGATFELWKCEISSMGEIVSSARVDEKTTNAVGEITFTGLEAYKLYYWIETQAPEGYEASSVGEREHYFVLYPVAGSAKETDANYDRAWDEVDNLVTKTEGVTVLTGRDGYQWTASNKKAEARVDVSITKTWAGDEDKPEARPSAGEYAGMVHLYADGELVSDAEAEVTDNGDNTYTVTYSDLPEKNEEDEAIAYTVKEDEIEGYTPNTTDGIEDGGSLTNTYSNTTTVKVSKVDQDGNALAGAELQLLNEDGEVVDSWDSEAEEHEVQDLTPGTYTLSETEAPKGYLKAKDIEFTIEADGTVKVNGQAVADGVIEMTDAKTKVSVSKTDIADGEELSGAKIELKDEDGNVIDSWVSEEDAHVIEGLEVGVEYTLEETTAPDGYEVTEATTFTINEDGTITTEGSTTTDEDGNTIILIEDTKTKFSVKKQDADEALLAGAELVITDAHGTAMTIDGTELSWTSSEAEAYEIEGLKAGTYTLSETEAPKGYLKADDIKFTIEADGTVTVNGQAVADGVIEMTDAKTKVSVSKVDIADGEELSGAKIELKDEDGNVIDSWVSEEDAHVIEDLEVGVEYTLEETTAPDGYEVTEATTFTINEDGTITTEGSTTTDEDGNTIILIEDTHTAVNISKKDENGGAMLKGAVLKVIEKHSEEDSEEDSEDEVDTWTTTEGAYQLTKVKNGHTYIVSEVAPPDGYTLSKEKLEFSINEKGEVSYTGASAAGNEIIFLNTATSIVVNKYDINEDKTELTGSVIQIIDLEKGEAVGEWSSVPGASHTFSKLLINHPYAMREVDAPDGYLVMPEDIEFKLDEDGKIVLADSANEKFVGTLEDGTQELRCEDDVIRLYIQKVDADGNPLSDVTLQLLQNGAAVKDSEGNTAWVSGDTQKEFVKLLENTEYTLREVQTLDGYAKAKDVTFELDDKGGITILSGTAKLGTVRKEEYNQNYPVIVLENDKIKLGVNKIDAESKAGLKGATIKITDSEGNVVDKWTSADEAYLIEKGLNPGSYVLEETAAPDGYSIAEKIEFTIDEYGEIETTASTTTDKDGNTVIQIEDSKIKFSVKKLDDENKLLADAELVITGADGTAKTIDGTELSWTSSEAEAYEIEGLKAGTYTLSETKAPAGYLKADDIKFTIEADGTVTVNGQAVADGVIEMTDAKTKFSVSKVDTVDGKELSGAEIELKDEDGNVIDSWVSEEDAHVIEGLEVGVKYTLVETTAPRGYDVADVITFTIDEEGHVRTNDATVTEDGVILVKDTKLIDFTVTKTWEDNDDQDGYRPTSIQVELLANGEMADSADIKPDEDGEWSYTFKGLKQCDENGSVIEYSVKEIKVDHYETEISPASIKPESDTESFVITNTHEVDTVEISGVKTWEDNDDKAGLRPGSITIYLMDGDEKIGFATVEADEEGNWSYSFTADRFKNQGKEIAYTIEEDEVENYDAEIDGYDVTNTIQKEEMSVSKRWEDGVSTIQHESVKVQLLRDGAPYGEPVELTESAGWTYTWETDPGYAWTVEEVNVPEHYTVSYDDVEGNALTVTNTYKADATAVTFSGVKTLEGRALAAGEFSFELKDEDGKVLETVKNAADGSFSFSELTFDEVGETKYTISEVAGELGGVTYATGSYSVTVTVTDDTKGQLVAEIEGLNEDGSGADFTNTYKAAETAVTFSGVKTLEGRALVAGEFSFELKDEDGKVLETVKNAADGKFSFSELTYDEAGETKYTISEVKGQLGGVTYATNTYSVTVTVTDDLEGRLVAKIEGLNEDGRGANFTNTYSAGGSSGLKTGDDTPAYPFILGGIGAFALALAVLLERRKRREEA